MKQQKEKPYTVIIYGGGSNQQQDCGWYQDRIEKPEVLLNDF